MRHFEFSPDVLAVIERDRFRHSNPLVRQRMEVLWLKSHGETHERLAELAGLSRATVQRILDAYEAGGVDAVQTFHWHIPTSELAPYQSQLEAEFRQRPPHTVADACQRIEQLTGVRRGPTQVRGFLSHTLGLRWRKVAAVPVPPRKTLGEHAATQAAFLKDGA
jgi:transposase